MEYPLEFLEEMRQIMSADELKLLLEGLQQEPSISIRLNTPPPSLHRFLPPGEVRKDSFSTPPSPVPWCPEGYYLQERPNFTFDPLLHAGAYYVQEASSMFITHVLRTLLTPHATNLSPWGRSGRVLALDLCAAPGGKSTCALSTLPKGSVLYSNEPIGKRAQILSENIQKWLNGGNADVESIVTNNYARDYKKAKMLFDIIIADVPCSGEGMFRKDPKAIEEWSLQNVEKCWRLQRDIVSDIWPCLKPGGFMIYSTCTFNTHENEDNVRWIMEELGANIIAIPTDKDWHITGSLLKDFNEPVYRFLPGKTRGEGLFMAVLQKDEEQGTRSKEQGTKSRERGVKRGEQLLHTLSHQYLDALNENREAPHVNVSYEQAIAYLRREAITLPDNTPRGIVIVCYNDMRLGLAKNVGNRANNLYPKEWRIKSTHVPA